MKKFFTTTFACVLGTLIAGMIIILVGVFSLTGIVASSASSDTTYTPQKNTVLKLTLSGALDERYSDDPLQNILSQSESSTGLDQIRRAIKVAAENDNVTGIFIDARGMAAMPASSEEIRRLCDEAVKYGCASVCIPPCHVPGAKKYLAGRVPVCTVIGFPNGYMTTAAKAFEAADAVQKGADEIDMVINLAMVKDADWQAVAEDIAAVRRATEGKVLKVIIECCLLTEAEKLEMCRIVSESGADFIKTSTGFSTGGATREDVALLRKNCAPQVKVKAAGDLR